MFARVNTIFGRKDKVEDGIAHLEETDRAVVDATAGHRGLTTLVDRQGGVIVAMSYWDEPTDSSDAALTRAREGAAAAAGGDLVTESYEVASQETLSAPSPGAAVRMERVRLEPARVADALGFIRDKVLAQLRAESGFCSAELLVDKRAGRGLLLTAWTAEKDATRADAVMNELRDEAVGRVGVTFPRTETYVLVRMSALSIPTEG